MRTIGLVGLVFALTWGIGALAAILALGLVWATGGTGAAAETATARERAELVTMSRSRS